MKNMRDVKNLSIGFLGLGVMGGGMAARLADAGISVTVWNRNRDRAAAFAARGITVADTPKLAARGADVVISMVADDIASRSVWLGPDGAVAGLPAGSLAIETSTVSPDWILELGGIVAAHAADLIDAPVTGSKTHAASGQLFFLVGGTADMFERAKPVLALMGRDAAHIGPLGSGARLKLINNFMCGVQAAALAESVALIERSGLDLATSLKVLSSGAPGSPVVNAVGPRMAARDYTVNFGLPLMHKDLSYAIAEGAKHGVTLSTARAALGHFDRAMDAGLGDVDFSAIVETLRREP